MQEFKVSKGYKWFFSCLNIAMMSLFIERVSFRRQRINLKDIALIEVDNQQAFVVSPDARLHIGQDISDRDQLLQVLLDNSRL